MLNITVEGAEYNVGNRNWAAQADFAAVMAQVANAPCCSESAVLVARIG